MDYGLIIQPTAGITYDDVMAARARAAKALTDHQLTPMDTLGVASKYTDEALEKMGIVVKDALLLSDMIRLMSMCKAVFICEGSENDPTSAHLTQIAQWFGMRVIAADNAA